MIIPAVFWLVPIASLVALGMAWFFFRQMMASDEGTPRMKEIALYVRNGAMAYLKQQYKVVLIVFVVLCALFAFMAYGLGVQNQWVPFAFLTGGFFSGLAGFFGMKTATYASARTANAARESLDAGLKIAFRCRPRPARHRHLVCRTEPIRSRRSDLHHYDDADLWHGCFYTGPVCPCGWWYLYQSSRCRC